MLTCTRNMMTCFGMRCLLKPVSLRYLLEENLSISHLIDSDFTFLNRKLAEHYGIPNVKGEQMRGDAVGGQCQRWYLDSYEHCQGDRQRISHHSCQTRELCLKNLLGLPSNPLLPASAPSNPIPGATTIRETLKLHQSIENCAVCHRKIDPPGFAMECFDPVGGYREQYRLSKGVQRTAVTGLRFLHKDYNLGRKVDCEGVTADGMKFKDIREFKKLLLGSQQQVTRNLVSQLIAFATNAVVQFADREEVEAFSARRIKAMRD